MNDIFISYSRRNKEFTRKLYDALIASKRTVWADWDSIPAASDWFAEIKQGIEQTNSVLFVLSSEWIKSNECRKELAYAIAVGKRLLPILYETVDPNDVPPELAKINWVYMRDGDDFDAGFQTLLKAMDTDLDWIKTHTRIQVRALEWDNKNRDHSFVLRGKDLTDGEQFVTGAAGKIPEVTPLQGEYILASRNDATRRQRTTMAGVVTALIVSIALGVVAVFQWQSAVAARVEAEVAQLKAEQEEARAVQEEAKAIASQRLAEAEARAANAGKLALESENSLTQHPQRALLLALEAVKVNQDANEPVLPNSEEALRKTIQKVSGIGLTGFEHEVNLIQFSKDNRWLVAGTNTINGEVKIWDLEQATADPAYQPYYLSFPVIFSEDYFTYGLWQPALRTSPQTEWLVLTGTAGTDLYLIADEKATRQPLTFAGNIEFTNPQDDNFILEDQGDQTVYWEIDPQTSTKTELIAFTGSLVSLSEDRSLLITDDPQRGLLLWNFAALSSTPSLLTEKHISDFTYHAISPDNEWFVLFQNRARPEYQVPDFDETYTQIGTKPWESTDIVLIPLSQNKKQEFIVELNMYIDPGVGTSKFSEDAKSFFYQGQSPPGQLGEYGGSAIGVLRFEDLQFINLTGSSKTVTYSAASFINTDWLYIEEYDASTYESTGNFYDLREADLFANGATPFLLLLDGNGNVVFSEDKERLVTQSGDFINVYQLEFNQFIQIEPASQVSGERSVNELDLEIQNDFRSVGMENYATLTAQSQDGLWFAAGGYDGSVRLWNYQNPKIDSKLQLNAFPRYISLSNDDQWLAVNGDLYQLQNGVPGNSFVLSDVYSEYGESAVNMGVFSPDSRWFVFFAISDFAEIKTDVYLADLDQLAETGEFKAVKINKDSTVYTTIQFSANGEWVLVGSEIMSYFTDTSEAVSFLYNTQNRKYHELPDRVDVFAFTGDQKHIALVLAEIQEYTKVYTGVEIWALPTSTNASLEKVGELQLDGSINMSRNGNWVTTTPLDISRSSQSSLYDLSCLINNTACTPFALQAESTSFSPNSQSLLTSKRETPDSEISIYEIWSLESDQPVMLHSEGDAYSFPSHGNTGEFILYTQFPPYNSNVPYPIAGTFTAWGGYNNIGLNVTSFDGYGHVFYGGFGGGGAAFGGYQSDYIVEAFDTTTKTSIDLRGHESNISASLISPDENFVLTYSGSAKNDGTEAERLLRLWDMEKMRLDPTEKPIVLPLALGSTSAPSDLVAMAISPNTDWVYIVDNNNVLHYYPISIEILKERSCIALGRNLTLSEWERFFPKVAYRKTCENLPEHPSALIP